MIDILFANFELTSIVSRCGVYYFGIFKKIWDITDTHEPITEMRKIILEGYIRSHGCIGKATKRVISVTGFSEEVKNESTERKIAEETQ